MVSWNKIEIVQKIQDYLKEHVLEEDFDIDQMYSRMGYSKRHCDRVFKELTGKTIQEYVKAIILSNTSKQLLETDKRVLQIAMDSHFETHEGYTRAFKKAFLVSPKTYRKDPRPIPLFVQYPIKSYYSYLYHKEELFMEKETTICMITVVEKPARKLLFLRSKKGKDYFSYCEEMGCDWEGLFNSIPNKMTTASILKLPSFLKKEGYSDIASGVELTVEYSGKIPEGCEIAQLEPCTMLYFESEPIKTEDEFFTAMTHVLKVVDIYDLKKYGFESADEMAPQFNLGGEIGSGARYAIPVKKIK